MQRNELDTILYNIRDFLNKNAELKDMNIQCLMVDKNNAKKGIVIASDESDVVAIDIQNYECEYSQEWDYDIDNNIFEKIESGMNIEFITPQWHRLIWEKIESFQYVDEIYHKEGLQNYLEYCRDNEVTKEYLEEECDTELIDIMKYSNDYMVDNNGVMEMSREKYRTESEIHYITFVLGYDLLNEMLTKDPLECDIAYDFCDYLARKFIQTDYYKNERNSTYDNLQEWVNDNRDIIKSQQLVYTKSDDKLILETGKRGDVPVALVKRENQHIKEYIVAFHYEIKDNKVQWGYGYYYDQNIEKAKADFEKVKAGGNLADTFNNEEIKNAKIPKGMEEYYDLKEEMETILEIEDKEQYSKYKIECVLINKNNIKKSYGIAMCDDNISIVDMEKREVNDIYNSFDIGEDSVFPSLQTDKMEIAYMSMEAHYGLWQEIDRYYPEDIKNKKGVQMYLKYCKENNITKELIDKAINNDKTPDIMKFYDQKIKNKNEERVR